jgi:hypothetical protein
LGFAEALVAGEGASAAGTQLAALFESFVEQNLHVGKAPLLGWHDHSLIRRGGKARPMRVDCGSLCYVFS